MLEETNSFGRFEFRPLEPGYGRTVGNALRRILLSSLRGFAICSIRIDGVAHELDTIPGVKEDVTNIILNLKQVRFKQTVEDTDTEKAVVNVSGVDVFKVSDLGKAFSGFEVLNPDRRSAIRIHPQTFSWNSRSTAGEAGFLPTRTESFSKVRIRA